MKIVLVVVAVVEMVSCVKRVRVELIEGADDELFFYIEEVKSF